MVILQQSFGLANSIFEYFTAYALAKELGEELRLDITFAFHRQAAYVVDLLSFPKVKKIYNIHKNPYVSFENPLNFIKYMSDSVILVQPGVYNGEETENIFYYRSLEDAKSVRKRAVDKNLVLSGYFMDKRYYDKYWQELRSMVALKEETYFTKAFSKIIKGKNSVAVHIRRGDFQVQDWTTDIEREYWQAAVMLMRDLLDDPIFMVFSDDIDYAVSVLGMDSHIFYVKFLGSQRADLEELICLSRCDHRILNVHSSYSRLADEVHGGTRIAVWKGINLSDEAVTTEKNNRATNLQSDGLRCVLLYPEEIKKRAATYYADGKSPIIPRTQTTNELQSIAYDTLSGKAVDNDARESMLYRKMTLDLEQKNYEEAYEVSQIIYVKYAQDLNYQNMLRDILRNLKYEEEASIEEARDIGERYRFIIAPYLKCAWTDNRIGLAELGNILYHMGHEVVYLFNTNNKGEKWYIRNNPIYMNRLGEKRGGGQFLLSDLMQKYGSWTNIIKRFAKDDMRNIVISRNLDCLITAKESNDVVAIFPDFSDNRCIESVYGNRDINISDLTRMYNKADIIFSHTYRAENAYDWQDLGHLNYSDEIDSDGQVINIGCHFQPLYVGLAFKIQEVLGKRF